MAGGLDAAACSRGVLQLRRRVEVFEAAARWRVVGSGKRGRLVIEGCDATSPASGCRLCRHCNLQPIRKI
ncbi:hypothetical protein Patl1_03591 [Pistacia atlantica]|uniref:Uncharacterized protein n=1 Tax=Pistacia atlantica TaxID=434234 RepID=A0ACC1C4V4_9ROSI|nr:hypothetical protein Patl1_03591 [Pistacia atlantica]